MSKATVQPESPAKGISGTRFLKNLRHLQHIASEHFPKKEPEGGFETIIPLESLSQIHKPEVLEKLTSDKNLSKLLKDVKFPNIGNASVDPLFSGTFYFVRVQFTIQNQGNKVISVSSVDMATAVQYATLAAYPISVYASQYGTNSLSVSASVIDYAVTLASSNYNDTQLQSWVNDVVSKNALPASCCVVVLSPNGLTNTTVGSNVTGYHSFASVAYIYSRVYAQNITIADEVFVYAQTLSHEMAETAVDPLANSVNPEVCDACAGNCSNLYLSYFDNSEHFIQTTQTFPPPGFAYLFYINAVVSPAFVNGGACPSLANRDKACNYGFPIIRHIKPLYLQHEQTAAWLIQLWLMIHGGDPAPIEIRELGGGIRQLSTIRAILGLAKCLEDEKTDKAIQSALGPLTGQIAKRFSKEL
jgi:hypothetical protein